MHDCIGSGVPGHKGCVCATLGMECRAADYVEVCVIRAAFWRRKRVAGAEEAV